MEANINKIKRDKFYSELYEKNGLEFIEEAGFFTDTSCNDLPYTMWPYEIVTPINFLKDKLKMAKNPCVLINTGSFCPIHHGHIEIMECAKRELEIVGYDVLGGYFSPGHDEYISSKNKEHSIPINYRIQLINEAIKDISWLTVDPWEGVFNNFACNFTDVVFRLEIYLKSMLNQDIPVFFVCGGDNARFALTFSERGHCVVVNRPGYIERFNEYKNKIGFKQDRIFFADCDNSISSTEVRKSFKWTRPENKNLQLRTVNHELEDKIIEILKPYYKSIKTHPLYEQRLRFWDDNNERNVISLDSLIEGNYNLAISRKYDLFGMTKLGYTVRPNEPALVDQINKINNGFSYYLFDDDIHTGGTIRYAKKLLEDKNIKIIGIKSLNITNSDDNEILDARDFIFGLKNAGLVIELPNNKCSRVPYIYPFVDPTSRCSIDNPMDFSIEIWKMNLEYWSNFSDTLRDREHLIDLFNGIMGENLDTKISDICKYYLNMLISLKNK